VAEASSGCASSTDQNEVCLERPEDGKTYNAGVWAVIAEYREGLRVALNPSSRSLLGCFACGCKGNAQLRAPVLNFDTKRSREERINKN
jgi:hypothetical protein